MKTARPIIDDADQGNEDLAFNEALLVGSSRDCDVTIRDKSISPHHLRITKLSRLLYRIEDLNSTHGSYAQGQRIVKKEVHRDDIIQIGTRPVEVRWLASHFSGAYLVVEPIETSQAFTTTSLIIGQQQPADIILQYPDIEPLHAEIKVEGNGNILISDKGSTKGTFVNGKQVTSWMQITPKDTICLGSYRIIERTLEDWIDQLRNMSSFLDNTEVTETEFFREETASIDFSELAAVQQSNVEKVEIPSQGTLHIGRDPESDVVIHHPSVSWNHAKIHIRGGHWVLIDLDSSNGTFVDGKRISKTSVSTSSWIRAGAVVLYLNDGKVTAQNLDKDQIRLDVKNLSKKIGNGKTILSDISISIYPSEVIALMGPSGAGKTALLECLTGKRTPTKGKIYLNGRSLHRNWEEFRHSIGYVPQDDVIHRDLTVYELLYYAAKMRLPRDLPENKVIETIENILTRMGLAHIRDSIIGDEHVRGISGGQRKRVNIALELITEPNLLFLDEPTSGLDATSTLEILQILRSLADSGKTIILTIHQPRIEAYCLMDNLLLLAKGGRLAYFGPANPDATSYFSKYFIHHPFTEGNNPADYIMDMLEIASGENGTDIIDWQSEYLKSTYHQRFVENRLSQIKIAKRTAPPRSILKKRSRFTQYRYLLSRYSKRKIRDKTSLAIQLLQAPVIGLILGWLFWQEGYAMETKGVIKAFKHEGLLNVIQLQNGIHASLFLIASAAFWFGCSNVAREIVSDRAIYLRERRTGLRSSSYLASIFSYQFILAAAQTFIIAALIWPMIHLTTSFWWGWFILLLTASCGITLGLLVSAISRTEVTAISVIPLLLLPQLMLGGFIKLYGLLVAQGLQDNFSDLMPIRWAFEALAVLEYQQLHVINENVRTLNKIIGFEHLSVYYPCWVITAFGLLFTGLTLIGLQFAEME
jgi:ABC transport system ATP-binding/permease protein